MPDNGEQAGDIARCRLYLISPPSLEPAAFSRALAEALEAGDVACFQLRLKDADDDTIRAAAHMLMPVCHEHDVAFLVNDRPDLAAELGADGVHVGQEDLPYTQARALVGPDRIVGVTCHDLGHLAMEAGEEGADYVAFGAFFATATKAPKTSAEVGLVEWWSETFVIPCVAIGGITVDNCVPLVRAGADFLAVSAGVWNHAEGPGAAVSRFNEIFERIADEGREALSH